MICCIDVSGFWPPAAGVGVEDTAKVGFETGVREGTAGAVWVGVSESKAVAVGAGMEGVEVSVGVGATTAK